jgi:hypothetical protein
MKNTHLKNLGMLSVVALIIGVCFYFSKNMNSDFNTKIAHGETSLESTSGGIATPVVATSSLDKISADISFLANLTSLEKIKIDTDFFNSKVFVSLKDNSVNIEKVNPGRLNPFAPIENTPITEVVSTEKIVTVAPSSVTDKSVILNGIINTTDGVTDIYFEYGKTNTLGTMTETVKTSLVGSFLKNVLGLSPKTNYFFKACAKINNITNCGETIPFTTK